MATIESGETDAAFGERNTRACSFTVDAVPLTISEKLLPAIAERLSPLASFSMA